MQCCLCDLYCARLSALSPVPSYHSTGPHKGQRDYHARPSARLERRPPLTFLHGSRGGAGLGTRPLQAVAQRAPARTAAHGTLVVPLEPLAHVVGVTTVAARLAPDHPVSEGRARRPPHAAGGPRGRRLPVGRVGAAHVLQADGAARQRLLALGVWARARLGRGAAQRRLGGAARRRRARPSIHARRAAARHERGVTVAAAGVHLHRWRARHRGATKGAPLCGDGDVEAAARVVELPQVEGAGGGAEVGEEVGEGG